MLNVYVKKQLYTYDLKKILKGKKIKNLSSIWVI